MASATSAALAVFGLRDRRVCCSSSRTKWQPQPDLHWLSRLERAASYCIDDEAKWLRNLDSHQDKWFNRPPCYFHTTPDFEMVGHPGIAPVNLLVPSQAGSLSPSCPIKNGGRRRALSPHQVVYWCLLFSRQSRCGSPVHLPLKWFSRRESRSRPSASQTDALVY